jgi:hypothetical protein
MITTLDAPIQDASSSKMFGPEQRGNADVAATTAANGHRKMILLPRRPGQSKFAPPQYYYPASRSGVMPSERFAA